LSLQSVLERFKLIEPKPRVNYAAAMGSPAPLQSYASYDPSGLQSRMGIFTRVQQREDLLLLKRLRELIPVLDMAIVWLRLLIGEPCIEAEEDVKEDIEAWMKAVNVNRVQTGFPLWQISHIDNALLYGRAHAEIIPTNRRDDVFGLVEVAPLTTALRPQPDRYHLDVVQHGSLNGPTLLNPDLLVTTVFDVRGDDPNGTSLLFGIPLVGDVYAKMVQCLGDSWQRWGNPSLYAAWDQPPTLNDPQGDITNGVMTGVNNQIKKIEQAKADGKTGGALTMAGKWTVGVLGAQGERLEFSVDAQSLMEQIAAKTKLPPFLFGFQWSKSERMSTNQALLLNEVIESYQTALTPGLKGLIELRQALVGRPADFELTWQHTSLQDRMEEMRAAWMEQQSIQIDLENQQDMVKLGIYSIEEMAVHFRPELEGLTDAEIRRRLPDLVEELPESVPTAVPFGAAPGGLPPQGPASPTGEGMRGLMLEDLNRELLGNGNGSKH
jgi:hypothetical protein